MSKKEVEAVYKLFHHETVETRRCHMLFTFQIESLWGEELANLDCLTFFSGVKSCYRCLLYVTSENKLYLEIDKLIDR